MNVQRLSLIIISLILCSCQQGSFYEKDIDITNGEWTYENRPKFDFQISEKKTKYDVFVNIRHNASYPYSNLTLLLHQKGPGIIDTARKYELKLAANDGRWLGNSAGSLYEQSTLIIEDYAFPDTGKYVFSIQQNMQDSTLSGIHDIGIKLVNK